MNKEKIILSFIAVLFGLLVAGIAFYLYQTTKTIPDNTTSAKIASSVSPTPTSIPSVFLTLDQPKDEEVVSSKILVVSGKTSGSAVIAIISDSFEDVITPSANGNFSTTVNLDEEQNTLEVIAIAPNGENVTIRKTVTYSLEEF